MRLDEFKVLAQAWGADIRRWPEHLRIAAEGRAGEPDAAAVLAEAERIDRFIIGGKPQISKGRIDRASFAVTAAIAAEPRRTASRRISSLRWLIPAASFASAAIVGVSLGLVRPLNMPNTSDETAALSMILDTGPLESNWVFR